MIPLNYKVIYKVGARPQDVTQCGRGYLYAIDGVPTIVNDKGERIPINGFEIIRLFKIPDFGNMLEVSGPDWSVCLAAVLVSSRHGFAIANDYKTKGMKDALEIL